LHHATLLFVYLIMTGAYLSFLFNANLFSNMQSDTLQQFSMRTQLTHNLLYAFLFQLYLTAYGHGLILATSLVTQSQVEHVMDNPLWKSASPSDFWGRRWNLVVHDCLKNGVYKPVRSCGAGRAVAVAAAFGASGLFHEWLLPGIFHDRNESYHQEQFGGALVFFAWQGLLVCLEFSAIGQSRMVGQVASMLPGPVRTFLVAHYFLNPYVQSDFFVQGSMTFPLVREVTAI
jgi:hypothetical protein